MYRLIANRIVSQQDIKNDKQNYSCFYANQLVKKHLKPGHLQIRLEIFNKNFS